jgi:predicted transcriptional regulator
MPTQSDSILHVRAPADLVRRIDDIARDTDRSRNYVARKLLEKSLTGADRVAALGAISAAEVAAANAPRERTPNASELIAESCTDGRARLDGLSTIARSNT